MKTKRSEPPLKKPITVLAVLPYTFACSCPGWDRPPMGSTIALERAFSNLTFNQPVWMQQALGAPGRWYVIEQAGRIRTFEADDQVVDMTNFVDIRQRVQSGGLTDPGTDASTRCLPHASPGRGSRRCSRSRPHRRLDRCPQ